MTDHHHSNRATGREVARLIELGRDREAAESGAGRWRGGGRDEMSVGGPMDALTQIDQMASPLGAAIAGVGAEQLDHPTPCAQFTVRGVLEHMIGGATAFAAAFRGEAAPADPAPGGGEDVLASIGPALEGLITALHEPGALDRTIQAPFGEVPGDTFARYIVLDGLVHGWDLSVATGRPYTPPDALVEEVERFARSFIDPLRDGDTFAAAVEPPAGATPIQRLAAFTGRPVHDHL